MTIDRRSEHLPSDLSRRNVSFWLSLLLACGPVHAANSTQTATRNAAVDQAVISPPTSGRASVSPGAANSINPQPLPPFPSTKAGNVSQSRWGAPSLSNTGSQSTPSNAACRAPKTARSGNSSNGNMTSEGIVDYCVTRTRAIDGQVNSKMNAAAKANHGVSQTAGPSINWSANTGQTDQNAELQMIQLQQSMSQRQQAVQGATNLVNGTKGNCPPKCPVGN